MDFLNEIDLYLRAKATLMIVISAEEERILEELKTLCLNTGRSCVSWDIADGFQSVCGDLLPAGGRDPLTALEQIEKADARQPSLYILKDFNEFWENTTVKRKLRTLA